MSTLRITALGCVLLAATLAVTWTAHTTRVTGSAAALERAATAGGSARADHRLALSAPPLKGGRAAVEPASPPALALFAELSAATRVQGRVTDEFGRPLAGVRVVLQGGALELETSSDVAGAFELPFETWPAAFSDPQPCRVQATSADRTLRLERVSLARGATVELGTWVLRPTCSVEGRVVDRRGAPVAGVEIVSLARPPALGAPALADLTTLAGLEAPGALVRSGPEGRFRLEVAADGRAVLAAAGPGWRPALSEAIECAGDGLLGPILIVLDESVGNREVAGVVLTPEGTPVAGAHLRYRAGRGSGMRVADDQGRFRLANLPGLLSELVATDPQARWGEARLVEIESGRADLVLQLRESRRFELLVHDLEGQPVENFGVRISRDGPAASTLLELALAHRENGRVALLVPQLPFHLRVEAPGCMPHEAGPWSPADMAAVHEVRLSPARGIRGRILAAREVLPRARVALHRAFEHAVTVNGVAARSSPVSEAALLTGENGEYLLPVPRAGDFYLRVEANGYAPSEAGPLLLGPEATLALDVELGPGGALECVLRSEGGADVAGRVLLLDRGDGLARTARTDAAGLLLVEHLTPGPWRVSLVEAEAQADLILVEGRDPARPFEGNCRVSAGTRTRVELWTGSRSDGACALAGELRVDGRGAAGWRAHLQNGAREELAAAVLDEEGRFLLEAEAQDSLRLLIRGGAAHSVLLAAVELSGPQAQWSFAFETAGLHGATPVDPQSSERALFHSWRRDGVECFTPLLPQDDGSLGSSAVPAGPGWLVTLDPELALEEQEPSRRLEVDLAAGQVHRIQ